MPDQPLSPHQAAQQVGVSVHTVRRWCADHAQYLSPSAAPAKGATRRLTGRDVEVLQEIARLRNVEGLTAAQVNERLAGIVFADTAIDLPQPAPGGPQAALAIAEAMHVSIAPLAARVEALEAQRLRVDVVWVAVSAFIAGLLLGLAVWFFQ